MKKLFILPLLLSACTSHSSIVAPSEIKSANMTYTINLSAPNIVVLLNQQYPNGIFIPPSVAQNEYYDPAFNAPNVYYGDIAPPLGLYTTPILVAPRNVVTQENFTANDWPNIGLEQNTIYHWVGTFVFAKH